MWRWHSSQGTVPRIEGQFGTPARPEKTTPPKRGEVRTGGEGGMTPSARPMTEALPGAVWAARGRQTEPAWPRSRPGTEVMAWEGLEAGLGAAVCTPPPAGRRLVEAGSSLSRTAGAPAVGLPVRSVASTSPLCVTMTRCHHVAGLGVLRVGLRGCHFRQHPSASPSAAPVPPVLRCSPWARSSAGDLSLSSLTQASTGGGRTWGLRLPWGRTGLYSLLAKAVSLCDLRRQPGAWLGLQLLPRKVVGAGRAHT